MNILEQENQNIRLACERKDQIIDELQDRLDVITEQVLEPIAAAALEKINSRVADRLRRVKGQAGFFVPNGIPGNPFEALCVLYREYRLENMEDAGLFIRKLRAALNEEFEKLSEAEKIALDEQSLYDMAHTEYKPYLDINPGLIMPQYLFAEFEQYLHDFTSDRIEKAYLKWIGSDWGPELGGVPEMEF